MHDDLVLASITCDGNDPPASRQRTGTQFRISTLLSEGIIPC